tara:strand:+ start:1423 stop:1623 length:201 start_codon:yes stop_codon:yes gene_type:complete
MQLTKQQAKSLLTKWHEGQHENGSTRDVSFLAFRRTVNPAFHMDNAVTVQWCGMWLAIETDGYTHS